MKLQCRVLVLVVHCTVGICRYHFSKLLHLCTVAPCCHARDGLCRAAWCQRKHDVWHCSNLHWAKVLCRRSRVSRHEKSKHRSWMLIAFFRTVSLFTAVLLLRVQVLCAFVLYSMYCTEDYISTVFSIRALASLCLAFAQSCGLWRLGWEPAVTCSELAGLLAIASWSCEHRHII